MIPLEERKRILAEFIEDPGKQLCFSIRQSIQDEFETWAVENGMANCVLNFLVWLSKVEQKELTATLFVKI